MIRRVFCGTVVPSESTPYVKNRRVNESGAAGLGSKGCTPSAPEGIKGSAAWANGTGKKAAVRTAAARTIDGLIRRLDLRRGVFIRRKKGAAMFAADSFNINCAKRLRDNSKPKRTYPACAMGAIGKQASRSPVKIDFRAYRTGEISTVCSTVERNFAAKRCNATTSRENA